MVQREQNNAVQNNLLDSYPGRKLRDVVYHRFLQHSLVLVVPPLNLKPRRGEARWKGRSMGEGCATSKGLEFKTTQLYVRGWNTIHY